MEVMTGEGLGHAASSEVWNGVTVFAQQKGQEEEEVDWKLDEVIHALVQALRRELMMEWGGVGGRLDLMS